MNQYKDTFSNLKSFIQLCLKQNIPFASYKLPNEQDIFTLVQQHSFPKKLKALNKLQNEKGFIISPFYDANFESTFLLEPDAVFISDNITETDIKKIAENKTFSNIKKNTNNAQSTLKQEFTCNIDNALLNIKNGTFKKVVLSKIRNTKLAVNFKAESLFLNLCEKYPHAFVYMLQMPSVGCWVGASPEPLINIENSIVKTVSLAGTQIATDAALDAYLWSNKEIDEQAIVTNFVENTLRSLNIKALQKIGPTNYQAANLIHLKTAFEFPEIELNNRYGDFLNALHPTPSVGGLPKTEAREFILNNEKHDRQYYTGYLGPININEKSAIFVNLRCLQLFDKNFVIYSGAGITASSIAEKEWEETDNKMKTLLNVMML